MVRGLNWTVYMCGMGLWMIAVPIGGLLLWAFTRGCSNNQPHSQGHSQQRSGSTNISYSGYHPSSYNHTTQTTYRPSNGYSSHSRQNSYSPGSHPSATHQTTNRSSTGSFSSNRPHSNSSTSYNTPKASVPARPLRCHSCIGNAPKNERSLLRRETNRLLGRHRKFDAEKGMSCVAIEQSISGAPEMVSVALTLSVDHLPTNLRRAWELENVKSVSVILDNVHENSYRFHNVYPVVYARKEKQKHSTFTVGEALANAARDFIAEAFHLCPSGEMDTKECFLNQLYDKLLERRKKLTRHCIVCGVRLKSYGCLPSLCASDDCYKRLGSDVATPRVSPDVLALLLMTIGCANASQRRDTVLTPKPVFRNEYAFLDDVTKLLRKKNSYAYPGTSREALQHLLLSFPCPRNLLRNSTAYADFKQNFPEVAAFISWLIISNKSYLERVSKDLNVKCLQTHFQFLFVSDSPEKQDEFDSLVRQNGNRTRFFFHGSRIGNWHSIIRNGLRNLSGTRDMINGQAFGAGIYATPLLKLALSYSNTHGIVTGSECMEKRCCLYTGPTRGWHAVALVEVVDRHDAYTNPAEGVFVIQDEKWCAIRMLLLYPKTAVAKQPGMIWEEPMCNLENMNWNDRKNINMALHHYKN